MEFKALKEIAEINSDSINKNYQYKWIEYLDTSNITKGKIDEIVKLKVDDAPSRAKRIVKENDIVYSTVRPNQCHYGIIKKCPDNLIVSTGFAVIRPNPLFIEPDYLYAFLTLSFITDKLQSIAETSTSAYPSIKPSDLEDILVPIFDIKIQRKISHVLGSLSEKIIVNNQINDNLQKLINNLYSCYFINFDNYNGKYKESEFGLIPEQFETKKFGDIVEFSNGYGWNSKDMEDNEFDNSYKIFKMGNINIGGGINKQKTKSWIAKEKVNGLEQYIAKKGDVLMCMTDMKNSGNPLLGHTALIDKDEEFVINQRVGIIRCSKGVGYPYIYTMSNMPDFINDIRSRANSGVQVNLTTKGICETTVVVPDKNTLKIFNDIAEPVYERIMINNDENGKLEQLRDTLLPKLMNGEIDLDKVRI